MYWNRHDMNGWDWFAMSISTVLLWALLITVAVLLFRTLNRSPSPRTPLPRHRPSDCSPNASPEGRSTRRNTGAAWPYCAGTAPTSRNTDRSRTVDDGTALATVSPR